MKIGFIGFGEAAFSIAKGFKQEGKIKDIVAFDAMRDDPRFGIVCKKRASEVGISLLDSTEDVASSVDVLFILVPCSQCTNVAAKVANSAKNGLIYADLTAASPEEMADTAKILSSKNIHFADCAVLGSVPPDLHKVPILASGDGADIFRDTMNPYGMKIESMGGRPGQASAVKLVRSIYMKGVSAVMLEMMCLADKYSVSEVVVSSISRSMDPIPFESHLNRLITGMACYGQRRAVELGNSVELQEKVSLKPFTSKASQDVHQILYTSGLCDQYAGERPENWKDVVTEVNRRNILSQN